jgi:hypothetical protein
LFFENNVTVWTVSDSNGIPVAGITTHKFQEIFR